ncbi:DUF3124 domain-containing protein [Oscillatoria sp. FACHB-1406]|uniref:DUF3124 domain-containing protein n=1 Tax=Oscillatoria sp. FACHB-1406 TaxID=2692846 RepID=UPI00168302EE|nr:DUF3124 domain-containing protein [Oscillatoria sp. FACHB-1406]MBD2577636.1 DUF3124 domain-containing protein [Oscillatoria sp. FACHB-1406]
MSLFKRYCIWQQLMVAVFLIGLISCSNGTFNGSERQQQNRIDQLQSIPLNSQKIVRGQTVYVPIYSHIYYYNRQEHTLNLSATLSIRNTDLTNSIIITAVRYYDTNGQLLEQFIKNPVELKPLASTDVFIGENDVTGGLGANFIVEWAAEKQVYEPVIEAVMISTASAQGISFVSPGRVLQEYSQKN